MDGPEDGVGEAEDTGLVTVIKDLLIQSCLEMVAYPFSLVPTHRLRGPISRAFDRLLMLTTLCSNEGWLVVREVRLFPNSWKRVLFVAVVFLFDQKQRNSSMASHTVKLVLLPSSAPS